VRLKAETNKGGQKIRDGYSLWTSERQWTARAVSGENSRGTGEKGTPTEMNTLEESHGKLEIERKQT